MSNEPNRRAADAHIAVLAAEVAAVKLKVDTHLTKQVEKLQEKLDANTAITEQVRDILASFRVLAQAAKWLTTIGVGLTALYHGADATLEFIRNLRK